LYSGVKYLTPRRHTKEFNHSFIANHSCDSNSWVEGMLATAKRDIAKNEEITVDYASLDVDVENLENESFFDGTCNCGSAKCRGKIMLSDYAVYPHLRVEHEGHCTYAVAQALNIKQDDNEDDVVAKEQDDEFTKLSKLSDQSGIVMGEHCHAQVSAACARLVLKSSYNDNDNSSDIQVIIGLFTYFPVSKGGFLGTLNSKKLQSVLQQYKQRIDNEEQVTQLVKSKNDRDTVVPCILYPQEQNYIALVPEAEAFKYAVLNIRHSDTPTATYDANTGIITALVDFKPMDEVTLNYKQIFSI